MEINCNYKNYNYANKYSCIVTSTAITIPNTVVKAVIGNHCRGKSNDDVEAIRFENTIVEYFPRGLGAIFPNLRVLKISNCGLRRLSHDDLIGLQNLTTIYIGYNKIKSLPSDLFTDMKQLTSISFHGNKLEYLSSQLLKPIISNGLRYVNFRSNKKIDAVYYPDSGPGVVTLQELMNLIDTECTKPIEDDPDESVEDEISARMKELWTTGMYSDFSIFAGPEEFRVHKNVLSVQSSIFAEIFQHGKQERQKNLMRIPNFSITSIGQFLAYFYIGIVPDNANCMELFALATKYNVQKLKKSCTEAILKNLNQSNAFDILIFGHSFSSEELKIKAFAVIKDMFGANQLDDEMINDPKRLKILMEAAHTRDRKIQEAVDEFEWIWKSLKL